MSLKSDIGKALRGLGVIKGRFISDSRWRGNAEGYTCLWEMRTETQDAYAWLNGELEVRLFGTPKEEVPARAAEIHSAILPFVPHLVKLPANGYDSYIHGCKQ